MPNHDDYLVGKFITFEAPEDVSICGEVSKFPRRTGIVTQDLGDGWLNVAVQIKYNVKVAFNIKREWVISSGANSPR